MMVKRTLMALGLGVALLGGGVASTIHASSVVAAHPTAVHAGLIAGDTGDMAADADANAPCATDPTTGDQTGNCQDSQNQSGPQDNSGAEGPHQGGAADGGATPG